MNTKYAQNLNSLAVSMSALKHIVAQQGKEHRALQTHIRSLDYIAKLPSNENNRIS